MKYPHAIAAVSMLVLFTAANAQQTTGSLQIGGQTRDYILYVPSGVSNPPLVINMHGLGSNASQQLLYTQFNAIANREKCIVVYPNAINNSWDLAGSTDLNFISALIDMIAANYSIDRNRVYATGMSMGGYMSHKLGCQLSDKIAAIAPVAGLNALNSFCNPGRPVPVLQIHGTADSTVKYSGVAATISGWVQRNGCPQTAQVTDPYPASNANSKVKKELYGPCSGNSEVVLLTVEGGGHVWPGGLGSAADINASEEVWAFLKRFSLSSSKALPFRGNGRNLRMPARRVAGGVSVAIDGKATAVRAVDLKGRTVAAWNVDARPGPAPGYRGLIASFRIALLIRLDCPCRVSSAVTW